MNPPRVINLEEDKRPLRVRRALISAFDISAFLPLARDLASRGVELWSTSGTALKLRESGLEARSTEDLTGIGSWFQGRVKTLHPSIFGGILAPRTEGGRKEMAEHGLVPFDLVAIHLYPFEEGLARGNPNLSEMIELIDVGGPSLLRAAAKNFRWVAPIPGPDEAATVMAELRKTGGEISFDTRLVLAQRVFRRTLLYDTAILWGISRPQKGAPSEGLPSAQGAMESAPSMTSPAEAFVAQLRERERLRYGENPHQGAWVYGIAQPPLPLHPWPLKVVKGDALSYNNYLDIETSLSLVAEFEEPAACVVKHATPCGVASAGDLRTALDAALDTDPVARYGCVIATNRPVSVDCADSLKGTFVDLLVSPGIDAGTMERLSKRPKLKVVEFEGEVGQLAQRARLEARTAAGRLLLEECDQRRLDPRSIRLVSKRAASPVELESLLFAWKVVRYVRSNAIVLSKGHQTVGVGGGLTSRVGAVSSAVEIAGERASGSVMASDAYFPFVDGIEVAGRAGVTAVINPGGSIRDAEVIAAADKVGMAMYFTGWRVFRH